MGELREKLVAYESVIGDLEADGKKKDVDLLNCANMIQEHKATIAGLQKKLEDSESREADLQRLQTEHLQLEMDHRTLKRDLDRSNHKVTSFERLRCFFFIGLTGDMILHCLFFYLQ